MILANITDSVCGTCLRSSNNGLSIIDFVNDGRNGWAQKASQKQVLDSIDKNVDLSFPVYGRDEWTTVGGYPYVPVAQHPGFVLVISRDGVSEQIDSMMQALVDIWPILLINTLLITLSGFCIWALVSTDSCF